MSIKQTFKKCNTYFQHFGNLFPDTLVDIYRTRFFDLFDIYYFTNNYIRFKELNSIKICFKLVLNSV